VSRIHLTGGFKMVYRHSSIKKQVVSVMSAVVVLGWAFAGSASAAPAISPSRADGSVNFGYFSSGTVGDWYESLASGNSADDIEAFVTQLELHPAVASSVGLGDLSNSELDSLLASVSSAAIANANANVLSSSSAISTDTPLVPSIQAATAAASYPVIGTIINGGWSWRYKDRYQYVTCTLGVFNCSVKGWVDITMTTNPGDRASQTALNFLVGGAGISGVGIRANVYRSGVLADSGYYNWSVPGYGSQYSPHKSMLGEMFQAKYDVQVFRTGGSDTGEYSTGKSYICTEPTNQAFRCVFH